VYYGKFKLETKPTNGRLMINGNIFTDGNTDFDTIFINLSTGEKLK